jgi:hypothetical protein
MCSHRLIGTTIANPPELNFGQEVLHGDLHCLIYVLANMHELTPKIQEGMDFQIWLIVKLILEKKSVWNSAFLALFRPLKQILPYINNLSRFVHFYNKS